MTLVTRWYQILELLVTHKKMSISELQSRLAASSQTIRKNIDLLNDELIGIAKIVQQENSFQLEIDQFDAFDVIMAGRLKKESDFNSSSKRVSYILKRLIEEADFIAIDDLSEELGVSRGTVNKDLRRMKQLIATYQVEVVGTPNRGLRIEGNEFDLRLLHIYFVQEYFEEHFLMAETYQAIKQLTENCGVVKHQRTLLPKVISIVLQRVLSGHTLKQVPTAYTDFAQPNEAMEQLLYHLELTYNVTLSQSEQAFIHFPFNTITNEMWQHERVNENLLHRHFQQMMKKIHSVLVVEIDEATLYKEMKEHLVYMLNRMIFRVETQDLFYGEIEKQYPFAYELAKIGLQELGENLQRPVPAVEFSYLALYFELVLRQNSDQRKNKEIAVVCSTGHGTALIIRRQLEKVLGSEIKIMHFDEATYETQDLNQYFAVFTTIPLKNVSPNTPVIQLTNLFNDTWIRNEWRKAEQTRAADFDETIMRFHLLKDTEQHFDNIQKMMQALYAEGLVDSGFMQRIIEREEKQTTVFESGIAFPHTINKRSDQIILSIGILPAECVSQSVEVILLLAIPENLTLSKETELLQLYDQFFMIAGNQALRQELRQQKDLASFKKWLQRKEIIT